MLVYIYLGIKKGELTVPQNYWFQMIQEHSLFLINIEPGSKEC